jgi:transcriptional regulator with XRE-family HTH domain
MPEAARASKRLGVRIRDLRKATKLTQEGLAAKAGIDSKYVQDIERGEANPTLAMLVAIAMALDLTLAELLGGV